MRMSLRLTELPDAIALWTLNKLSSEDLVLLCEKLVGNGNDGAKLVEIAGFSRQSSIDLNSVMPSLAEESSLPVPSVEEATMCVARLAIRQKVDGDLTTTDCLNYLATLWSTHRSELLMPFASLADDLEGADPFVRADILDEASVVMSQFGQP